MVKKNILFLFAFIFVIFISCSTDTDSGLNNKSIVITDLVWYIENIDFSYWDNPSGVTSHLFYAFFINYEGDILLSDIESATISSIKADWYWSIDINEKYFDSQYKEIGGWTNFWYEKTPDVLPVGDFYVEVKLKNGNVAQFTKNIPIPGDTTSYNYNYIYTEDYTKPTSFGAPMIKRAIVDSKNINYSNQTISINFSVYDNIVFDGSVLFYDSNDNYLGFSNYFRDGITGNPSSLINNGENIFTNGNPNNVIITNSDINFENNYTFNQISKFIIELYDGYQYALTGDFMSYDCRSISAKTSF